MDHGRGLAPGTMIAGEWRVERTLGVGGFGVTYEARNPRTQAHVALKEYMPAGCCSRDPKTSYVTAAPGREGEVFHWGRERFMKEAETLGRLGHPSIVRVITYFEANGTAYMGLAFEPDGTLRDWLDRLGRRPTEAEIDALLWPLLDALSQVHSLFLLHRDIKPENVMLRADGTPVLIDFGSARSAVAGHTQILGGVNPAATSAFAVVSDGYSPPEQYDPTGKMTGPASDIYSLGGTVYTALVGGRLPSAASRHFNDDYQPLAVRLAGQGYRPELLAGIDRALAVHPKDRPQSAIEFRRAIGLTEAPRETGLLSRALTDVVPERGGTWPPLLPSGPRPVTFSQIPISAEPKTARSRARVAIIMGFAVLVLAGMAFATQDRWLPPRVDPAVAKAEADRRSAEANATRLEAEAKARRLADLEARLAAEQAARERSDARAKAEEAERQRLAALQADDARKRGEAEERAKAEEADRQRLGALQAEGTRKRAEVEAKRKPEASRPDPIAALVPGSGQSARDRRADGSACTFCPGMVVMPSGRFTMGSSDGEEGRNPNEGPVREVRVRQAFAVGRTHITRGEFAAFVRDSGHKIDPGCYTWTGKWELKSDATWQSPGFAQDDRHPIVCVNWDDAKAYAKWLSDKTGQAYRLLTEAEAEYAIRGVTSASAQHTRFWFGNAVKDLCANANGADQTTKGKVSGTQWAIAPCSDGFAYTAPVASFKPNTFGLYDAVGNAWTWTQDCWIDNYRDAPSDERARTTACTDSSRRVVRGGSWSNIPQNLRSADRYRYASTLRYNSLGFRLARTLNP